MRKIIARVILLLLVLWSMASSSEANSGQDEKKLVVYVAFHENEGKALLERFKQKTGVDYTFLRMPAGEILTRVRTERNTPRADVILGGGAENHELLKTEGLLARYQSAQGASIPLSYRDKDGYWTGFYVGPVAIGINKARWDSEFAPQGLALPEQWDDLLHPAFAGEIVMPSPESSGTGYVVVDSVIQARGEKDGFAYVKKLHAQVSLFTASGFKPAQMAGEGDKLVCINFLHDQLLVASRGMPLISKVPKDAGWEIGAVSILARGPNPENAQAFVDFVLGPEAGTLHSQMTQRVSTRADVWVPGGAVSLDQMAINKEFSFSRAAMDRQKILKMWAEI